MVDQEGMKKYTMASVLSKLGWSFHVCIHMTVLLMRCCMVRSNCAGEESEQIRPVSSAYKLTSGTTEGRSLT